MKNFKKITTMVLCSMMVFGSVITASAAENTCKHINYVVDSSSFSYVSMGYESTHHFVYEWEETCFCLDCQEYFVGEKVYVGQEPHFYGIDNHCVYCGDAE